MDMKVEIISKETIKPSSPTPAHLRRFAFSFFDQFAPSVYIPLVLFYADTPGDGPEIHEIPGRMKSSLSETLARFYPFAGRIVDNLCVDCTDDGADYFEAQVTGIGIREILQSPDPDVLKLFLPVDIDLPESFHGRLMSVQLSFFNSGGVAVGICVSHKIADTSTLSSFLHSWAAVARGGDSVVAELPGPDLSTASTLFPPSEALRSLRPAKMLKQKCQSRRYCFGPAEIAALQARAASAIAAQPTRVEAMSAFIWKCAMEAAASSGRSLLAQTVNIRKRTEPSLAPSSVGCLISYFTAKVHEKDEQQEKDLLPMLVVKMREGMEDFLENYAKKLGGLESFSTMCELNKRAGELVTTHRPSFYSVTSWCRFGFYEVDFGWGRPDWTSICSSEYKNVVVLMDARDGLGAEAWVTLGEAEMAVFEKDQDLLRYAAPNPSAWPGPFEP
ncbi:BAHD acyltransferase At5g47980-like [Syzygium oleosum]|uniref:BAHD acyltransferase At5g47980-like n=1 Tax=Syzygium oleosum TaxID=219896 RepID=UPI0024B9334D|nr:BAHD acyltransferase At5g47980-like [Syzygium oleosum]